MQNPFKPTAGKNPPMLIGRDFVIEEFSEGIENGPGAPGRLMRITGMRGMGKTVMLNEIGATAKRMGWEVIEETASEGFCDRILALATSNRRVSSVTAAPSLFGVSLDSVELDRMALSLREALHEVITRNGKGLLITLDEVQDVSLSEMRALSVAIQHEIREDCNIAFVFAGLPSMIESVVNGKTLTFLRRAVPVDLGPVGVSEVAISLRETMRLSGMMLSEEMSELLAEATKGYPFMVQLVGYHVWQLAHRANKTTIDEEIARNGVVLARERFDLTVIEPALQRLPSSCIAYLLAMAEDEGKPSDTSTIAERMGKSAQQIGTYRARLIHEDVIEAVAWGKVSFAIPYMADFLNMHRQELEAEIG